MRLSLPVMGAYLFLGTTYGILAASDGYSVFYPLAMAAIIYSGSVEFLALTMLLGRFNPLGAFLLALMVGARHLFYGITMLDRWRGAGWRKPLLIFMMSDETFAVNLNAGGSHARQLYVSLLDYGYWLTGALIGYLIGYLLGDTLILSLRGIDFAMTAMFVAIFTDDFIKHGKSPFLRSHLSAYLGLAASAVCLVILGPDKFIIPSMILILLTLYMTYRHQTTRTK